MIPSTYNSLNFSLQTHYPFNTSFKIFLINNVVHKNLPKFPFLIQTLSPLNL